MAGADPIADLREALGSSAWLERAQAVGTLARRLAADASGAAEPAITEALLALIEDPSREVRSEVANASAELRDREQALHISAALVTDRDRFVRQNARRASQRHQQRSRAETKGLAAVSSAMAELDRLASQHEPALSQKTQALAYALYEQVAAFVCHDVANVLCALEMRLRSMDRELSCRRAVPKLAYREHLDASYQQIHLLEAIVRDMKAYATSTELQFETALLEPMLREAVEVVAGALPDRTAEVELRVQVARPLRLEAPRNQLVRAFVNIAKNGVEAIEGSGSVTIDAELTQRDPDVLTIRFADTGRGMRPRDIQTFFAPGMSTKKSQLGPRLNTGMGLTIARQIIERDCGGELALSSRGLGKGATAIVSLPVFRHDRDRLEIARS